ncbi:MAG: DUF2339 domain-containing protein [Candidatus Accumulibacter sp.]|jgi:uncharacterized membrane protein|nr:DUF2339 domain-containing protein [Accumulibacter sp.]
MALMTLLLAAGLAVLWNRVSALQKDNQKIRDALRSLSRDVASLELSVEAKKAPARDAEAPSAAHVETPQPTLASARVSIDTRTIPATAPEAPRAPLPPAETPEAVEPATLRAQDGEATTPLPPLPLPPAPEPTPTPLPEPAPESLPEASLSLPSPSAAVLEHAARLRQGVAMPKALPDSSSSSHALSASVRARAARLREGAAMPDAWLDFAGNIFAAAKNFLFGGNTVLHAGVLLLFIGLAFLLRYVSERVSIPVEFRYIGVAATALALLALGWLVRRKNAAYGLTLQGTGIAVLYLTCFAAMHLHRLLPPSVVFVLLVALTAAATVLAVVQDAVVLASAAAFGGFATPILASTGSGDHVALFSYFALLSTGILLVAWFKAWRILNLIGFTGTFGIGFAWGIQHYAPEKFASVEAFLSLFFLMYVSIGLLFARRKLLEADGVPEETERTPILRWSVRKTDYVDGVMIFGPALAGFGLQYAIVDRFYLGTAFSALGLGLFYLTLAFFLRRRKRVTLLMEICIALGAIFTSLTPPLAFGAHSVSSAIWAVEGAGIYWLSLVQKRKLARFFSLVLIASSALAYLRDTEFGRATLLENSILGAALLGAALLFCHRALRRSLAADDEAELAADRVCLPVFAVAGLAFVYLVAPLSFGYEYTVVAWAVAGLATTFASHYLNSRAFLACGLGIQGLGGVLFLIQLEAGETGIIGPGSMWAGKANALGADWMGLLCAALIGLMLVVSEIVAQVSTMARRSRPLARQLELALLAGLVFINLAPLFVLEWNSIGIAWAMSGLLLLWVGLWQRRGLVLYFGAVIEAVAGLSFLYALSRRLASSGSWAPVALALAAAAAAWFMHRSTTRPATARRDNAFALDPDRIDTLSSVLLAWGMIWWVWATVDHIFAFTDTLEGGSYFSALLRSEREYAVLFALSLFSVLWTALAHATQWRALALLACGVPLAAATGLLTTRGAGPFALGAPAWTLFFFGHLFSLRRLAGLYPAAVRSGAHVAGAWIFVGVLTLAGREFMVQTLAGGDAGLGGAWPWLGGALAPSLYLWFASGRRGRFWPLAEFGNEYRFQAAFPMAVFMFAWFWAANSLSTGDAAPLPYVPLANPLELGLLLVLFASWRWSRDYLPQIGVTPESLKNTTAIAGGAAILSFITMMVCRAAHFWSGVPFRYNAMVASMGVQAGWSLVWSLFALVLMIGGNRRGERGVWMTGAVLTAVVVAKLFLVELSERGSLARVVSFIGVGLLLLVVGYFSPLPPKTGTGEES